jgi:ABC-type lipoprotein export system ATPase subunit
MKSEFLFLDETINNLDAETVGRVADLFNNFVKKNVKKLYIVTHSQQIQDMDIWSDIVDLAQLKKHQQG